MNTTEIIKQIIAKAGGMDGLLSSWPLVHSTASDPLMKVNDLPAVGKTLKINPTSFDEKRTAILTVDGFDFHICQIELEGGDGDGAPMTQRMALVDSSFKIIELFSVYGTHSSYGDDYWDDDINLVKCEPRLIPFWSDK